MNNPMIWAVPTVPISAGEAKCVRTMSGTREPRIIKSMTSKKSPAVTIAKTRECILPITALSSVVSTYSTIDCANVLLPISAIKAPCLGFRVDPRDMPGGDEESSLSRW